MKEKEIRNLLENIFQTYHRPEFLEYDPLGMVHQYSEEDRELVGLLCALFAYGRVRAIRNFLHKLLSRMGEQPQNYLKEKQSEKNLRHISRGLVYRFYTSEDIYQLLLSLNKILKRYKNLKNAFYKGWNGNILESLWEFQRKILNEIPCRHQTDGIRFMISNALQSPSKRWHMFLRWMVRKDSIDFGTWDFIPPSSLLVPLDVHLFDISKKLGFTDKKTPNLRSALTITERFRDFSPKDPVKFDFSLCRVGILNRKDPYFKDLAMGTRSR